MRAFLIAGALAALAGGPALAGQTVVLRQNIADEDGRVTLGELFDGAGAASDVAVSVMRPGSSAILDAATVQRMAMAHGLSWTNPAGLRRIVVRPGAAVAADARSGSVEALTFTRNLNTGDIVGPEDLAWGKVFAAPAGAPRDANAVIGMSAKRPLRAGSAIAMADVSAPLVIRKDDVVSVTYAYDGVSLTLQAKALQAAGAGETFNVVNPSSKKIIQAVAVGPGQAAVGPDAVQYRAQPGALASIR